MTEEYYWPDISFVTRSPNRRKVLEALSQPITPTDLSKKLKLDRGYVSNLLIGLMKRGLAECLTPDEIRHKLFKRTKTGNEVLVLVGKR